MFDVRHTADICLFVMGLTLIILGGWHWCRAVMRRIDESIERAKERAAEALRALAAEQKN